MKTQHQRLVLDQLDRTFEALRPLQTLSRPAKGWVRAVRDALGMSGRQLAERLGLTKGRISAIEQDEVAGNVTLKTMQRVAEGMDCVFVYAIVPRTSLRDIVRARAEHVANARLKRTTQTMLLENQALSRIEERNAWEAEVERLMQTLPRSFWDDA